MIFNMKNYNVLILVMLLISLVSCEKKDMEYNAAEKYLTVYSLSTDFMLSKYLQSLDMALKLDEYLNAGEEDKVSIEDLYFPYLKIREVASGINIRDLNAKVISSFSGVENTLSLEGVSWSVKNFTADSKTRRIDMNIKCLGENEYEIEAYGNNHTGKYYSDKTLYLKSLKIKVRVSKLDSDYAITGFDRLYIINGNLKFTEYQYFDPQYFEGTSSDQIDIMFNIEEDLYAYRYNTYNYDTWGGIAYYDGKIHTLLNTGSAYNNKAYNASIELSGTPANAFITIIAQGDTFNSEIFNIN